MSAPFVAEIRVLPYTFAPKGWAWCNGQVLPISQNTALFALLGTYYGGDGKSTFALPNLEGSVPVGQGQSSTGTDYFLGQQAGEDSVTLLNSEIPVHTHQLNAVESDSVDRQPGGNYLAKGVGVDLYGNNTDATTTMAPQMITPSGGSIPHNNMQPYLCVNFCIAMQGVFPPRG
jgi:microcystin-dependent protein